jgi:hypothetical protein
MLLLMSDPVSAIGGNLKQWLPPTRRLSRLDVGALTLSFGEAGLVHLRDLKFLEKHSGADMIYTYPHRRQSR